MCRLISGGISADDAASNYPNVFQANNNPSILFQTLSSPLFSIFYNGHFAALIFFVLSGYVLTLPYFEDRPDSIEALARKLWGRYLRLNIPIAVAVLASYAVYRLGLYSNLQASDLSGSVNWLQKYFPPGFTLEMAAKEAAYASIISGLAIPRSFSDRC